MKRHAVTLVIAALAVLATAYLLIVDRGTPSDAERAVRAHRVLSSLRADEVTRIDLDRPNDHLILERAPAAIDSGDREWRMRSPVEGPADQAAASALLALLDSASPLRAASDDPAEFTPLRASLTITMPRVTIRLSLGTVTHTPEGAGYARVDANTPLVVTAELANELLLPGDRFRAKQIVPNVAERLEHLDIKLGKNRVTWTRTGPSSYRLATGERASRAALDRIELALVDLRADSFVPVDVATRLTSRAPLSIMLQSDGAAPITLHIAPGCPDHLDNLVVLRDAGENLPALGACLAKGSTDAFEVPDENLVERHVFQAHADEVSELRLDSPAGKLELARKGSGWHERVPQDRDLSVGEVEAAMALLDRMVALEGVPHAKRAVTTDRSATLRYGEPAMDDRFDFDAAGASEELDLTAADVQLLTPNELTLRPLSFWDPPVDRLHVDAVTLRCDGREQRVVAANGAWSVSSPIALPADGPSVLALIDFVTSARADRWRRVDDVPSCTKSTGISLISGDKTACVGMIQSTNGETIAVVEQSGAPAHVAVTDADFRARACASLVDRHRFVLSDDADTVTLRLAHGAAHRIDVRALRAGAGVDEDGGAEVAAFAALDGLVADDVAHLGAPTAADALSPAALVVTVASADAGAASARTLRFGGEIATPAGPVRRATVDSMAAVFTFSSAKLAPLFAAEGVIQKAP